MIPPLVAAIVTSRLKQPAAPFVGEGKDHLLKRLLDMDMLPDTVGIIGSREFEPLAHVTNFVGRLYKGTLVVSGGARGVDRTSVAAARKLGYPWHEELPDKSIPSPARFFERNQRLVDYVHQRDGLIVAFALTTDSTSIGTGGTRHAVKYATKVGAPVITILRDGAGEYHVLFNTAAEECRMPEEPLY